MGLRKFAQLFVASPPLKNNHLLTSFL